MLELEDCRVDLVTGAVEGGRGVPLTDRERRLLEYVCARPMVAVARDELLREVFGCAPSSVTRAADTAVFRLREKIERDPGQPRHLLTAHGVGYRFVPRRSDSDAAVTPAPPQSRPVLTLGPRQLDLDGGVVHGPEGAVALTEADLAVLRHLADHLGAVVPTGELARRAGAAVGRGLIHRVRRLRRLLEPDPERPRFLLSARGRGYRLVVGGERPARGEVTIVQLRPGAFDASTGPDRYGAAVGEIDQLAAGLGGVRLVDGWRYVFDAPSAARGFADHAVATCPVPIGAGVVRGRPLVWTDPLTGATAAAGVEVHRAEALAERAGAAVLVEGAVATGLPWVGDLFVGRAELVEEVRALLRSGTRLVTLEGPPGVGKSRLALEVLGQDAGAAVVHVALRDVVQTSELVAVVAAALGVVAADRDPEAQLRRVLGSRGRVVLWLDDADRVAAAAPTLAGWLGATPGLAIVATARRALGHPGEVAVVVPPLDARAAADLFAARAHGVAPDHPGVAELVTALDGLPLALELAAARTRALPVATLVRELPNALRLLAAVGDPARRSVRAALDLSWELLGEAERDALCRAATFRTPFAAEAAAEVLDSCAPGGPWALDLLEGLVRHHLVRVEGDRYALLESVRAYAAERLRSRPDAERRATAAHAARYAAWGGRAALDALGRGRTGSVQELVRELPDLEAAVSGAVALGRVDLAEGAALALAELRLRVGPFASALPHLDRVLSLDGPRLAELLARRGRLRILAGDVDGGRADLESASSRALAVGDRVTHALAETTIGSSLHVRLPPAEARAHHERALEAALACLEEPLAARIVNLARLGVAEHVPPSARVGLLEEALAHIRRSGDAELEAQALGTLSIAERARGRTRRSRELAEFALALHRATGDRRGEAIALGNLANPLRYSDPEASARYNEECVAVHRRNGNRRGEALARGNLGALAADRGDFETARGCFAEAVELLAEVGARTNEAMFRGNLGAMLCKLGRIEEGRDQLVEAVALVRPLGPTGLLANPVLSLTQLPGFDGVEGIGLLDEALAEPELTPGVGAHLRARRARLMFRLGDVDGARSERRLAEALLAELGEDAQVDATTRTELRRLVADLEGVTP